MADPNFQCEQLNRSDPHGRDPSVTFRIFKERATLFFPNNNDNVTVDVTDLVDWIKANDGKWNYRNAETLGIIKQAGNAPAMEHRWTPDFSDTNTLVFWPPEARDQQNLNELIITFFNITVTKEYSAPLIIELTMDGTRYDLPITIELSPKPPKITLFRASPSIVTTGNKVDLTWACEDFSSYTLRDKDTELFTGKKGDQVSYTQTFQSDGRWPFTLTASREGIDTSDTIEIMARAKSEWVPGPRWWEDNEVAGLIVSRKGDNFYALVPSGSKGSPGSIWWSADGFSRWTEIDTRLPAPMATSPAVYFNDELYLLGGSKINPHQTSNEIHRFTLNTRQWQQPSTAPWKPRMGHACVVFDNKVWVMGGIDRAGNPLNDIWIWDGTVWKEERSANWPARCLFSAVAFGDEIWIGGGFSELDGTALYDLWKLKAGDSQWQQVQRRVDGKSEPLRITDEKLCASTLVALKDTLYIVGYKDQADNRTIFSVVKDDGGGLYRCERQEYPLPLPDFDYPPSRMESVVFNGCIWVFLQGYRGRKKVEVASLYYWVPPRPTSTITT